MASDTTADIDTLAKGGRTNIAGFVLRLAARIPFLFIAGRIYGPDLVGPVRHRGGRRRTRRAAGDAGAEARARPGVGRQRPAAGRGGVGRDGGRVPGGDRGERVPLAVPRDHVSQLGDQRARPLSAVRHRRGRLVRCQPGGARLPPQRQGDGDRARGRGAVDDLGRRLGVLVRRAARRARPVLLHLDDRGADREPHPVPEDLWLSPRGGSRASPR